MSTKTKKKLTLPKGLPPLPAVPEGYSAWEYMGLNWKSSGPVGAPFGACYGTLDATWYERASAKELGRETDALDYDHHCHIIRAIKRPAPANKQPKAKAVKANFIWVVEILDGAIWKPCADAFINRRDGLSELKRSWNQNNPDDKFRLVKYVRSLGIIPKRKGDK